MTQEEARAQFILLLQLAYSGELGAIRAYLGHRAVLKDPEERAAVGRITRDEIRHRHCLLEMMRELGAEPDLRRERKLARVGRFIAFTCAVGGWFVPMYGAGRLERDNVGEYEHAARLAVVAGLPHLAEPMLEMAEVEWDHERFFREKSASHWLWRLAPHWPALPPREHVRTSFAGWLSSDERAVEPLRIPWIVR